jgi:hypothetical protein
MGSRPAIGAVLLLGSLAGLTACGDESGSSTTQSNSGTGAVTRQTPPAENPQSGRNGAGAEEYPGVFAEAKEVCAIRSHERVAQNVGSKSTRAKDIARALANGYKPKLRRRAYRGCLAGLRDPTAP